MKSVPIVQVSQKAEMSFKVDIYVLNSTFKGAFGPLLGRTLQFLVNYLESNILLNSRNQPGLSDTAECLNLSGNQLTGSLVGVSYRCLKT